ncbi:serine-rich adhesin for platelets-like isoform X4 [Acanthochromis polyacanthus]|uniref:serine-rich adhesin for platelets-like isoform X4 n=1 Tax=Acanthochromis polyacanthus TaxID=80966 RepID=UPI0022348629|nr:serine-rich adhesin for platelets-like isoform X4 [Acanthochromis polyacanthus]
MSLALLALIFLVSSSLSDAVIYKSTGGEVVIPPGSAADLITAITWKHNEDIAMEWYGGEPSAFRQFNGCTTLNTLTGELTISGLTREHSGSYTAEINNKVAGTTEVRVISPVPTPTVSMWCDAEMTYCTLTCEGNTTDPELVTYSWQIPDAHKGRQVNITKEDSEPWFRCEMQNPISSETSENFSNPFLFGNRMVTIILIPCIILLLIGLVVGICIYSKCKFKKTYSPTKKEEIEIKVHSSETPESNNHTENTELREVSCNGAETSALIPQTSSVVPDVSRRTETSSKKEEETQALIHRSGTPESNDETATTTSKGEEAVMSVAESSSEAATDTQDQSTSRNDLTTAASTDTATTSSEGEEAVMSVAESSSEAATDSQDQSTSRNDLTTAASTETATTSSEGEEAVMSVAESSSEAATDSQDQSTSRNDLTTAASTETATTSSEGEEAVMSVAESSSEAATDTQDQSTSRNDLTAASTETEESPEESNGEETTRPLLEAQNQSVSVSA